MSTDYDSPKNGSSVIAEKRWSSAIILFFIIILSISVYLNFVRLNAGGVEQTLGFPFKMHLRYDTEISGWKKQTLITILLMNCLCICSVIGCLALLVRDRRRGRRYWWHILMVVLIILFAIVAKYEIIGQLFLYQRV